MFGALLGKCPSPSRGVFLKASEEGSFSIFSVVISDLLSVKHTEQNICSLHEPNHSSLLGVLQSKVVQSLHPALLTCHSILWRVHPCACGSERVTC